MDYSISSTIYLKFTSSVNGVPTSLAGSPAVSAYANGSATEITAGITLTQDFDSLTGLNHIAVVASVANGYAAGTDYSLVITAGTLNGTSVVGTVVGEFSVEKESTVASLPQIKQVTDKLHSMLEAATGSPGESRFTEDALRNAPAGSGGGGGGGPSASAIATAVWSEALPGAFAAGAAGQILGDNLNATVGSRATQVSVDTIDDFLDTEVAAIKAKTDNLPSDPADASDIATAFGTVNSTLSTIDARLDTEIPQIKQVTDKLHSMLEAAPGSPGESRYTADALVNTAVVLPNINAIKAKTDNLPSDPADASDIATAFGTVNATLATIDGRLDTEVPQIKQVTDKLHSMLEAAAGSPGESRFTTDALRNAPTGSGGGSAPSASAVAAAVWAEALPGAYSAGQAGQILGDNLNATVGSRATQTSVDTIAGYLDTEVAAIKAKTDNLPTDPADASDIAASFAAIASTLSTIDGRIDTEVPQIKQVTDKLHSMLEAAPGSPGESRFTADALVNTAVVLPNLNAIKAKTDNLPSDPADASDIATAFGTVNATLATIAGYIDTEVAAIKAKTDNLPSDPADASDIAAAFGTVNATLATIAGYIDTEVAAIKAKTDNLPSDPADASDIAASFSTVNATLATIDARLDTEVPQIKQVTDKLHSMLEAATGSPGESRFTVDALRNAPTGSGGGGGSAPSAADVAAAVWAEALPGAYSVGAAGRILGDNLNATVGSRATQTSVDTIAGYVDTEVAAIKAKTDNLPADPADASDIASSFGTVNATLATIAGYIDTEVAAIKAKTDNLPASPASTSDIPTAADVAVQVWSEDLSGYTVDGSAGLALSETDLRGERTVCRGTVSGTAPTNTTFTPSALSPAGAATDQFKGRVILFDKATTTPELRGQATVITGSTSSSLPLLTFEALSHAPVSGDTFSIV